MGDQTRWRCSYCNTINGWSESYCSNRNCQKKYDQYKEVKLWECSQCGIYNVWDMKYCGHCNKRYQS